jgi:hypothetical protein
MHCARPERNHCAPGLRRSERKPRRNDWNCIAAQDVRNGRASKPKRIALAPLLLANAFPYKMRAMYCFSIGAQ